MPVKNYYSELPVIPYQRTYISMDELVKFANTLVEKYGVQVIRTAYIVFRNESANGTKGVNDNFFGIQADNARWSGLDLSHVVGTCVRIDSGNVSRRFICFDKEGYKSGFDFVCFKVAQRGMYIGAEGVKDKQGLAIAYLTKWVGLSLSIAKNKKIAIKNYISLYNSSVKAIPSA